MKNLRIANEEFKIKVEELAKKSVVGGGFNSRSVTAPSASIGSGGNQLN